jgi:hypothetical protein
MRAGRTPPRAATPRPVPAALALQRCGTVTGSAAHPSPAPERPPTGVTPRPNAALCYLEANAAWPMGTLAALSPISAALSASGTLAPIPSAATRAGASKRSYIGIFEQQLPQRRKHWRSAKRTSKPGEGLRVPHPCPSRPPATADRDRLSNSGETKVTLCRAWSWDDGEFKTVFYFRKRLTRSRLVC